jgi:hypothetical protein
MKFLQHKISINSISLVLGIILILGGCNKDGDLPIIGNKEDPVVPTNRDTFFIPSNLKSFYNFKVGSRWVYQRIDTNATVLDTARTVRVIHTFVNNELLPFVWEKLNVVTEHTYYKSSPASVSPHLSVSTGNTDGATDRISMTSQGLLFKANYYFFSVPLDSVSMAEKSSIAGKTTLLDTNNVTINGNNFKNVVHLKHGLRGFFNEIWMAKEIGLIKYFNQDDSTTWELKNYHIN